MLAVGLYANFAIAGSVQSSQTAAGNYGDTQFVSADKNGAAKDQAVDKKTDNIVSSENENDKAAVSADKYFAQARIDKKNSRAEAAEVLQSMYSGGDATDEELAVVAQDTVKMTDLMEAETKIETILKAQGFDDALCYLSGKSANIIVKTPGLDSVQAAQIKDALLSEVDVSGDNITIVEVN